jgi:hypothetical protein
MSHKLKSPIFCNAMVKSENYMNKKGERPLINSVIDWNFIVFNNNDMIDDQWLFINDNSEIVANAKKQYESLKFFDDYVCILE